MESARKRKHSSVASTESASSSRVAETEANSQEKRPKLSPGTAQNIKKDASLQDSSTCGKGCPPRVDTSILYECSICLDSTSTEEMRTLSCSHSFHKECIDRWLLENTRCPVCRMELVVQIRFETMTIKVDNVNMDVKLTHGGVDVSLDNGNFIRLNNVQFDMRVDNDDGFLRVNENGIQGKLRDGGFMRLNKDGLYLNLINVTVLRHKYGMQMMLDNGGFMNFKDDGASLTVV